MFALGATPVTAPGKANCICVAAGEGQHVKVRCQWAPLSATYSGLRTLPGVQPEHLLTVLQITIYRCEMATVAHADRSTRSLPTCHAECRACVLQIVLLFVKTSRRSWLFCLLHLQFDGCSVGNRPMVRSRCLDRNVGKSGFARSQQATRILLL